MLVQILHFMRSMLSNTFIIIFLPNGKTFELLRVSCTKETQIFKDLGFTDSVLYPRNLRKRSFVKYCGMKKWHTLVT